MSEAMNPIEEIISIKLRMNNLESKIAENTALTAATSKKVDEVVDSTRELVELSKDTAATARMVKRILDIIVKPFLKISVFAGTVYAIWVGAKQFIIAILTGAK